MKKLLLTMRAALLIMVVCAIAMPARASVTINVKVNNGESIYLYAWDDSQNPLNGTWPGTEMTTTTTVQGTSWFTKTFTGVDKVNFILSQEGSKQTNDLSSDPNNRGVTNGKVYFEYDESKYGSNYVANLTDSYDLPAGVTYSTNDNCVYFVNSNQWERVYCHFWRVSDGVGTAWPGGEMTKVGTNGNGWDVYKWTSATPDGVVEKKFIIHDNTTTQQGQHRSPEITYTHNDYITGYDYSKLTNVNVERQSSTKVYNTPAFFSDANMRAALQDALGVPASSTNVTDIAHEIAAKSVKILDISGHSITETSGITYFTELEELYAFNNNIKYADLQNATKLRTIDLHKNEYLLGFGIGTPGTSNHVLRLPSGCVKYIDMSNTRLRNYAQDAFANKVAGTLETFIARDVYYTSDAAQLAVQNVPGLANLSKLKYLDVSGCDGAPATIVSTFSNTQKGVLEYLDISNQHMTTNSAAPSLDGFTALETFKFGSQTTWNKTLSINNCKALTSVNLTGNSAMIGLNINNCDLTDMSLVQGGSTLHAMTTLNVDNNLLSDLAFANNFAALTTLSIKNNLFSGHYTYNGARLYPVQTIDMSNNSGLTGVSLLNNCVTDATASNNGTRSSLRQVTLAGCPSLTTLAITGADIYIKNQFAAFDATNKTTLQNLNFTNNNITHYYNDLLDGSFTALNEIDLSSNPLTSIYSTSSSSSVLSPRNLVINGVPNLATMKLNSTPVQVLTVTGSPLLETVNVTGETALGTIDLSSNGLSSPVTVTGWTTADAVLKYNDNDFTAIPTNNISANVSYLYLLRNEFQPQLSFNGSDITYKGVALSNKSTVSPITSFTAAATAEAPNTTLEAINLDGNTSMTDLTVNYFDGLTQTASDADMTTAAGKGLYIKRLSALENIDISHNAHFEKFGQDGSTTGLSAVKTFDGSHDAFYTFSNKTAIPAKTVNNVTVSNGRSANPTFSTLEDLTALETLKLNDNQLCDSVHLWQNRNLKYLDLSNNRTITQRAVGDYRVYRKGDGTTANWAKMVADRYTGDTNDTVGLRMLDLFWNQNLEYINISNTAIQNTAKDHYYMCNFDNPGTTDANSHPEKVPHYILVNRCKKLLEFHADNNGMKSLGIGSNPRTTCYNSMGSGNVEQGTHTYTENGVSGVEWVTGCPLLEKVSVKGARGQDPNIMMGELNISANNPNVWYYDASGGNFDYIGTANGANLKYLDVSGNYQSANEYVYNSSTGKWESTHLVNGKTYTTQGNPYTLNTNNNPLIETIIAQNCPALQTIVAQDVDYLTTFDVTQQPGNHLTHVYIDHNAVLPGLIGLETLSELNTLWVNDDPAMTGLNVTANTKLECLHAQNNPQFGETETKLTLPATSSYLKTLWVSGDNLGNLNNDKDLCVSGYANLDSLICDDNNLLYLSKGDNLATNTKLRHLNCDNNKVADLSLSSATLLEQVKANNNDLFTLALGASHPNLVELKFANNHVNGINLAGATALTQANYDDTNNGRQITANHQKFYTAPPTQGGQQLDLYYFQLVNGDPSTYGNWVCNETSGDAENHATTSRRLGDDGFDASKWASATVSRPNQAPRRTPATSSDLDASKVYGTIAVLTPTAEGSQPYGTADYEYDNGNSNISSNFHLDWTASPTVLTGIEDVPVEGTGVIAMQGGLVVEGAVAGQVLGIYDLQGREVRNVVLVEGRNEIDLPAGVYIVNGSKVLVR